MLNAEVDESRAIIGILHQDQAGFPIQEPGQNPADARLQQACAPVDRRKDVAQPGNGVDLRDLRTERGNRPIDAALHARVMQDLRLDLALDASQRQDRGDRGNRR